MAKYTRPELRERLKDEIKASDKGGRPGQWSARKSQLLTNEYKKRGGGFEGPKDERQRSLQRWGGEQWQTRSGDTRARKDGETRRYLPKQAWEELSEKERQATDTRKRRASRSGRQYVSNTGPAKRARRDATAAEQVNELPVAEAVRLVRGLDTRQLNAALRRERGGKARKTLIGRLESELGRRRAA
ncbi:hypothetical protein COO58_08285 [Micromonospora sp. WMMA1996]|uniref:DUF5872 domain-containing protein n=1 Tax=Micromonospora sp. WMMA1996 TaxID=2039878 RepID=UPI000BF98941|nr:DUF5872 domain-containing protein [Micromonospora sp. WMMA1996]PGH44426.1 hypothetical protein COO58_08285 [Micromonospora sp. WMMA1996]